MVTRFSWGTNQLYMVAGVPDFCCLVYKISLVSPVRLAHMAAFAVQAAGKSSATDVGSQKREHFSIRDGGGWPVFN